MTSDDKTLAELAAERTPPEYIAIPMTPTEMLIQMALEKGQDPGRLYEILATERADNRKQAYLKALADFQARVPPVVKKTRRIVDRGGNTIDYASLEDIRRHVDPLLRELGLTLSYSSEDIGGKFVALVKLSHTDGHTETARLPFEAAKPPGASNNAQAIGAGQTYAMRYLTTAILGLWFVDPDTDAEPAATVIPGPVVSDEQARDIADAIIQAADRTGNEADAIMGRVLKAYGASTVAGLPASSVPEIIDKLEGMKSK